MAMVDTGAAVTAIFGVKAAEAFETAGWITQRSGPDANLTLRSVSQHDMGYVGNADVSFQFDSTLGHGQWRVSDGFVCSGVDDWTVIIGNTAFETDLPDISYRRRLIELEPGPNVDGDRDTGVLRIPMVRHQELLAVAGVDSDDPVGDYDRVACANTSHEGIMGFKLFKGEVEGLSLWEIDLPAKVVEDSSCGIDGWARFYREQSAEVQSECQSLELKRMMGVSDGSPPSSRLVRPQCEPSQPTTSVGCEDANQFGVLSADKGLPTAPDECNSMNHGAGCTDASAKEAKVVKDPPKTLSEAKPATRRTDYRFNDGKKISKPIKKTDGLSTTILHPQKHN